MLALFMSESSFLNQHLLISLVALMKSLANPVNTLVYHILYKLKKKNKGF